MTDRTPIEDIIKSVSADLADHAGFALPTSRRRFQEYAAEELRKALERAFGEEQPR